MTNQVILKPLISYAQMEVLTGRNRRTLWFWWAKDQSFPKPIMKGGRAIGWKQEQYNEWLAQLEGANHE
ncbi:MULTISPECIES: helix-turn-helix transcriptional regulator [unclassified Shewanella]|uniref:helix-turn-helix transcriptional regulator n=1 Tax=Shewanella TaxID=22 RepID=UPI0021DA1B00|nr:MULTISPECIES: AlpA family phage regulatory protein [unclassified Shewanella]MCU8043875.1 AlpA family phage regulatory protein [Shewanella sp. SM68]MCU8048161.1 AlpA family phage regulatory protein [Shewanella sp. SM65]